MRNQIRLTSVSVSVSVWLRQDSGRTQERDELEKGEDRERDELDNRNYVILFTWPYQKATRGGYGIFTIGDYQWVLGPKPK